MTVPTDDHSTGSLRLAVAREWPTVLFLGVVTAAIGVAVMVWPSQTLTVLSILLGIQLLLFGLFRLIGAFAGDTHAPGLAAFFGIISMIAGIVVLRNPFETVEVLATILGVVWIIGGAIEVISAIAGGRTGNAGLAIFSGLLSLAAGIIVVSWPAPTVTVIAWIAGIYLLIAGVVICAEAFSMRRLTA